MSNIKLLDDPLMNAGNAARFEGISIPTMNRRIRTGDFPPPDYVHGQIRYWKRSTILAAREKRIAKYATANELLRETQLANAARARAGRGRAANPE